MSMTVREIVDECDRCSIRILCYGDFEVRLYLREDAESPVPEWLESAARERALETIDYVRFSRAAEKLKTDAERRLRAICKSKRLRKSPLWQYYDQAIEEAVSAQDLERLGSVLEKRERHVIFLFGDERQRRRERRYLDKYGG